MLDRERLEALLVNRFPGAGREQIAAAANAIMALIRELEPRSAEGRPAPLRPASRLPRAAS